MGAQLLLILLVTKQNNEDHAKVEQWIEARSKVEVKTRINKTIMIR